ncbi:MAG: hypothetical protein SF052_16080 [Bacteroidia bacterium]|nr:hypothetical protein [Bacteroidia bacterium]
MKMSKPIFKFLASLLLGCSCNLVPAQSTCNLFQELEHTKESETIIESLVRNIPLQLSREDDEEQSFTYLYSIDTNRYPQASFLNTFQNHLVVRAMIFSFKENKKEAASLFYHLNKIIKDCKSDHENGNRHCYLLEDGVIHLMAEDQIMVITVATYKDERHNKLFYNIVSCLEDEKIPHLYWIDGYAFGEGE